MSQTLTGTEDVSGHRTAGVSDDGNDGGERYSDDVAQGWLDEITQLVLGDQLEQRWTQGIR